MSVERNSHPFPSDRKSRTVFIKVFFRNVPWSVSSYFLFVNLMYYDISPHTDKFALSL